MPFEFFKVKKFKGLYIVRPKVFKDERGFFMETYKQSDFEKVLGNINFVQDDHSKSIFGVLRGLHYQLPPKEQGKLVRCIKGKILDIAVDIRKGSKTFGKWLGVILSEENKLMLYIPTGFAHGFLTLSRKVEIIYKVSKNEYSPEHDGSINSFDKDINIPWEKFGVKEFILSEKDKNAPSLKEALERGEVF